MSDVLLRDGSTVSDPRLDRLYEEDWRSLNYLVRHAPGPRGNPISEYRPRSMTYRCSARLDQGREGACVSTGCGHELAAYPVIVSGVTFAWCREAIYHPAQHRDPWEGCSLGPTCPISPSPERYEGTSVLAGVQMLQELGYCSAYDWALTLRDVVLGLGYRGPGIVGVVWKTGMRNTDAKGFIHATGQIEGGHCLLARGVRLKFKPGTGWFRRRWEDVDLDRSYILLLNSWGPGWGEDGHAKITLRDFEILLQEQGEVCFIQRTAKRSVVV